MTSFDIPAASPKRFQRAIAAMLLGSGVLLGQPALATVVQIQTNVGDIQVNLFDKTTPKTVANFLAYVNASNFANNVVYRAEPGFVIQAGGYSYPGSMPLVAVTPNAPVANEPVYSNVRGTIAMAKVASDANSATNQWFINLADNSANLDVQNSGFSVFGQVTASGMTVVDAIAALNRFSVGIFTNMPLRNFTAADAAAGTQPNSNNLVLINSVIVLDANPDSAASLNPPKNTLINAPPANGGSSGSSGGSSGGGGGGSVGLAGLLALGLLFLSRKARNRTTPV